MSMDKETFLKGMMEIFATFGKSAIPQKPVLDAIYQRVHDLPDGFMAYAVKRCQDMEKLPANLGAFLRKDLWPDYYETHPTIWASDHKFSCHRCKHDDPGLKQFWSPDGECHLCACDCCTDQRRIQLLGKFSDEELQARGFLTVRLLREETEFGKHLKEICKKALGEHKPRPAHEAYMKSLDAPDAWQ